MFSTNGPKEIMSYEGFPFRDMDDSERSFVPAEHVLQYLIEFSEKIRDIILVCR